MLSEEMLIKRTGNFTASQNFRLMAGWDTPQLNRDFDGFNEMYAAIKGLDKKPLVGEIKGLVEVKVTGKLINDTWAIIQSEKPSAGLVTYAQEKAIEELFDPDPSLNFSTVHTRNGEEREVACMELLADETGVNFIHTGENQVHIHADQVGCTPDGVATDELDLIYTGAEVKCKSPLEHAKNLLINNNEDLKKNAFEHFVQIQTSMLVTGAEYWYFANYNPFAKESRFKFKHIIIERDNEFIAVLEKRINMAKEIKRKFLNELLCIN